MRVALAQEVCIRVSCNSFFANEDRHTPGSVADGPAIACDRHVHRRKFQFSTTAKRVSFRPLQLLECALHDVVEPLRCGPRPRAWPGVLAAAAVHSYHSCAVDTQGAGLAV